jgi:hypothetical protein
MRMRIRDSESFHLGSGIGEGKIPIRDKHPGSATLLIFWCSYSQGFGSALIKCGSGYGSGSSIFL